jgi:hypothetical protein
MDELPPETPPRPPIAAASLSVILAAAGSSPEVTESVGTWERYLQTLERPFEILLVPLGDLDGSSTDTQVRRVEYDATRGHGAALDAALRLAQHPLAVLAPADRQIAPSELKTLLGVIDQVDLAIGCRSVAPWPAWLRGIARILGWVGWLLIGLPLEGSNCTAGATPWRRRWTARWAFGVRLKDPESPFRLMRREAVCRIVLQSRGPFALVEQLAKANHLELIMSEEPVAWTPPTSRAADVVPFAQEARLLFHRPDFGPPELHVPPIPPVPPPASPQVPQPEKAEPEPTPPAPPSS